MEVVEQIKNAGWTTRRIILATLVVVAVTLVFYLFLRFHLVLFSLFEAIVFRTAISPAVEWLQKRGVPRGVGIALIFLVIAVLMLFFLVLAAPLTIEQAATVSNTLTTFYNNLHTQLSDSPSILVQRLVERLPNPIILFSSPDPNVEQPLDAFGIVFSYVGMLGNGIFAVVAVLLLTFYWTLDRERTIRSFLLFFPVDQRDNLRNILEATENRVGAYIRGLAILCGSVGLLAMVAYLIMGLPHALLLGVIAGVLEIVPIIGPILGALPAVVVALSYDPSKLIWVIAAIAVIQFSENNLLVPRIMDKTVGVNPVVSLLAFAAFSSLFGLAGAILAIPIAVLIQILLDRFLLGPDALVQPSPQGRDRLSLLRYEAQRLAQDVRKQVRVKEGDLVEEEDEVEDAIEAIVNDLDSVLAKAESNDSGEKQ